MADEQRTHPKAITRQRLIAASCIAMLSIVYLAGYLQWSRLVGLSEHRVTAAELTKLAPPPSRLGRLAFVPDVPPPETQDGLAPVLSNISTTLPVVFLTIDDGVFRDPEAATRMSSAGVPASLFLTDQYVGRTPSYFSNLAKHSRSAIENHTLTHKDLTLLGLGDQQREICGASDAFGHLYGKRPTLFRPPYGNFNEDTRRAVAQCGMRAVVLWRALVEHGTMHYQVHGGLQPGDIVLMHFTPSFTQDLDAFVAASKAAGLTPQLLEDWLTP